MKTVDYELVEDIFKYCIYTDNIQYLTSFINNKDLIKINYYIISLLASNENLSNCFSYELRQISKLYVSYYRENKIDNKSIMKINCLIRKVNNSCKNNKTPKEKSFEEFIRKEMLENDLNEKYTKKSILRYAFSGIYDNILASKIISEINEQENTEYTINSSIISSINEELLNELSNLDNQLKSWQKNDEQKILKRKMK